MGNMIIGERIAQRRKSLGLTLDDVAQEIGLAKSTVQRYEKGTIETIKLPVIEAIANILKVDPAWICGKTEMMELAETEKAPTPEDVRQVNDDDIRAAFFGGADDLTKEEMDAMWNDAKDYVQYKLEQRRRKKNGGTD